MSQADEKITMQDAYGTVEVPAAPKQKSIKRLVASVGRHVWKSKFYGAFTPSTRRLLVASSSTPSTRRLLDGGYLKRRLDRK